MSSYTDHISEVFIKPIRSVLAIDDKFPTLDDLISEKTTFKADEHSARLFNLLSSCRKENPQWLIDVHDGKDITPSSLSVPTVRQCNWLILDYKLDGDSGDGSKAIAVLRSLASSDHFNLVVIYTAEKAETVFYDIVVALSDFTKSIPISSQQHAQVENCLVEWEDSDPIIQEKLTKIISVSMCFALLRQKSFSVQNAHNSQTLAEFNHLIESGGEKSKKLSQWIFNYFMLKLVRKMCPEGSPSFSVIFSPESAVKRWLVAENIFVSVEEKATNAGALLENLKAALNEWRPSPNQLIISKLRTELEASGIKAEEAVVSDKNLQAFWLNLLLESDDPREESHHIGVLVERQMELLADELRTSITDFTVRVIRDLKTEGDSLQVTKKYLDVDTSNSSIRDQGMISHNTHVSTKPASGKNLMPGHVLRISEGGNDSYWICLSPACDLEAGRDTGRELKKRVAPWMPFTGLKLFKMPSERALELATRGWVLFLDIEKRKEQFSYFPDADPTKNPVWEEFLAKNEGRLTDGEAITVARIQRGNHDGVIPKFHELQTLLVAQLRSEYAASLTLRLTGHLSRIGLDYISNVAEKR